MFLKFNWFQLAFLASSALGIMAVLIVYLTREQELKVSFVMIVISVFWLISYLYVFYQETGTLDLKLNIGIICILLITALLSSFGNLALFTAAKLAPNPGLVIAINSTQIVIVTLLALFLLKDKISLIQSIGILSCVIGIILIGLGKK